MVRWWHGWAPLILLPTAVIAFSPADWPRWAFMWLLTFAIYCGCKWLTWRRTPAPSAPLWRHVGYLLAWPGMDAPTFFNLHRQAYVTRPSAAEWLSAAAKSGLGLALFFGLARWLQSWDADPYVIGWVGMVAVLLSVHFGLFHLLSCGWRHAGVAAVPLMNWPLVSVSVADFWGKRWNLAFRDLTHRFLFRPLTRQVGPRFALGAGFVFSGLVHDLAISLPAHGGYGGPSLFFIISGVAIFLERAPLGRRLGLGVGWRGWLFTLAILLGPVYLLVQAVFVEGVMVPFMQAMGAIQ
jgi:alginate O-acetyltransferase complex protein AlgI